MHSKIMALQVMQLQKYHFFIGNMYNILLPICDLLLDKQEWNQHRVLVSGIRVLVYIILK